MSTIINFSTSKSTPKSRKINSYKSNTTSLRKQYPNHNAAQKKTAGKRIQSTPIQGVIHIKCSLNNTIVTLTDLLGKTKAWVSCGTVGFKGSKRSSRFAGQAAIELLGSKAKTLGYRYVVLHLNGLGRGRNVSVKGLKKSGLRIYFIKDFTSIAHNGCRPSKLRRL